jgi:hypothetical protein
VAKTRAGEYNFDMNAEEKLRAFLKENDLYLLVEEEEELLAILREAVAAERESIAMLAEELEATYELSESTLIGGGRVVSCHDFASAIREQGNA